MRIMILDENFETLGVVGVFNSLIWTRRYYEAGAFELHFPASYFNLIQQGKYLFRNDRKELGVIRNPEYEQSDKGQRTAYCKGYFAESLLDNRIIPVTYNKTGTPEDISRDLINKNFINPSDSGRKFPHVVLGKAKGIGTSVSFQSTGDTMGEKMYSIEQTQEMSHRLAYDYKANTLTFEVWKGLDRRDTQDINSWAVFSDSFYNVKNVTYERNDADFRNYAYVAGEGEGTARTVVEVDGRTDLSEERREIYVDARDLRSTYTDDAGTEHTYSVSEYKSLLYQRGLEKLSEYSIIETVNSDVDAGANLVYMTDFDLGDLCTYQNKEMGIECAKRITEIQEVYEGSKQTLNVTFGTDSSTSITKLIRREVS